MNHVRRTIVTLIILTATVMAGALPLVLTCVFNSKHGHGIVRAWMMHASFSGTDGVVLQTGENACGPSALAMILTTYGIPATPDTLERELALTSRGVTMAKIKSAGENYGLQATAWRLNTREIQNVGLPALLFLRHGHFVVLDSVSSEGYVFLRDPAIGRVTMKCENLQHLWNGETLLFGIHESSPAGPVVHVRKYAPVSPRRPQPDRDNRMESGGEELHNH